MDVIIFSFSSEENTVGLHKCQSFFLLFSSRSFFFLLFSFFETLFSKNSFILCPMS